MSNNSRADHQQFVKGLVNAIRRNDAKYKTGKCFLCGTLWPIVIPVCDSCKNLDVCEDCFAQNPKAWEPHKICRVCEFSLARCLCNKDPNDPLDPSECDYTQKGVPCINLNHRPSIELDDIKKDPYMMRIIQFKGIKIDDE